MEKIETFKLFEKKSNIKVKLKKDFISYIKNRISVPETAAKLNITELFLKRKIKDNDEYSFNLKELLILCSLLNLSYKKCFDAILYAKEKNGYWHPLPRFMIINQEFVLGLSYYIGDGRMKTNKGLSTVNSNKKIIYFFIEWLKKYFNIDEKFIKIVILISDNYNLKKQEINDCLEVLKNADQDNISIKQKSRSKPHHKTLICVAVHRSILKNTLDKLVPIVKRECLKNKKLALAYLQGIMAAEGSCYYDHKSRSRNVRLKMKSKEEVKYIKKLMQSLGIISSKILYSKKDKEYLIIVSGVYELFKLKKIEIFKLHSERSKMFQDIIKSYIRKQTKQGCVESYYLKKIINYQKNHSEITAPQLARYINRHRSRTLIVLKKLYKQGYISEKKRSTKLGTPRVFYLNKKGLRFGNSFTKTL